MQPCICAPSLAAVSAVPATRCTAPGSEASTGRHSHAGTALQPAQAYACRQCAAAWLRPAGASCAGAPGLPAEKGAGASNPKNLNPAPKNKQMNPMLAKAKEYAQRFANIQSKATVQKIRE